MSRNTHDYPAGGGRVRSCWQQLKKEAAERKNKNKKAHLKFMKKTKFLK